MKRYHYLYLVHDEAIINKGNLDFKKLGITKDLDIRLSQYNSPQHIRPMKYLETYQCKSKPEATIIESKLKKLLKDFFLDKKSNKTEVFKYNNQSKKIFDRIINQSIKDEILKKLSKYKNPYLGNEKNKPFNSDIYKLEVNKLSKKYLLLGFTEKEILDIITKKESQHTGSFKQHPTRPSKELIKLGSDKLWYTSQAPHRTYYKKYCNIKNDLEHLLRRKSDNLNFTHEVSLIIDQLLKNGMKKNKIVGLIKKCQVAYELSDNISDWQKPKIEARRGQERRGQELPLPACFNNIALYWENKSGPVKSLERYLEFKKELENIE